MAEARDREEAHCRSSDNYFNLRRHHVAAKPALYNREQGTGDENHNLINVVMLGLGTRPRQCDVLGSALLR